MPIKLIVCVRPGVELTWASFCPSRELIRLDLPTLERPRKANSGGPSTGKNLGSAAEVRNLARMGFMRSNNSLTIAGVRCRWAQIKQQLPEEPRTSGDQWNDFSLCLRIPARNMGDQLHIPSGHFLHGRLQRYPGGLFIG